MLFSSFDFSLFFLIVFTIYFFTYSKRKFQNGLLLVASYVFYGWWDWRFLFLILISSVADFAIGESIYKAEDKKRRKVLLMLSMGINLGILGFFKYFNFFMDSMVTLLDSVGVQANPFSLTIILPVGISFYTFQTMSYTIDIYKKLMKPTSSFLEFMTFVSFFPQLVAGPIERAAHLLPQFGIKRKFEYHEAKEGLKQVFWGLFKKIVIADNCAVFVNQIFDQQETLPGSVLVLGAILFAFQIYGDFSGYSDMAIGISRIMGFDLMQNFAQPYLAVNIQDFWRRWHISLSTWFRDYVYIPLGGSRVEGNFQKNRNIFITFTVSGLWHGANWTFVIWGMLHSFFLMINIAFSKRFQLPKTKLTNSLSTLLTFLVVVLAWVFFRAETVTGAFSYLAGVLDVSLFSNPFPFIDQMGLTKMSLIVTLIMILVLVTLEMVSKDAKYNMDVGTWKVPLRYAVYFSILGCIFFLRSTGEALDFIYFQF